jgi:NADH-quinone oxidoreductase subunit L
MSSVAYWILIAPFIGAVLAYVLGKTNRSLAFWVAEIVGGSLFVAAFLIYLNYGDTPIDQAYTWIEYGKLSLPFGIYMDKLSVVMLLVVTGLSFADIHFAHDYMGDDPDQARYYAKVLFFVGGMILLVSAKELTGAFVGWELMGLASYLLISFWFTKAPAANAGMQAFLYTRIGDIFILAAIGLLMYSAGTLDLEVLNQMANDGKIDKTMGLVIALFIFMGAIGKSGQFPLYPWLMNAMEGPTTVSALIHGATMVNSGIYIVARLFDFYAYTEALFIVANVAALSAFIGATSAVVQKEMKKILAYSTMSHLSLAFVGLGTGSLAAGMIHLANHAVFKALLFLSAGAVIFIAHHTKDAWKLGGLLKVAPFVALFMAMGSLSLSGVPPFSGYFSKEFVVASAWANGTGMVKTLTTIAALLSIVYITRLWVLIFMGEQRDSDVAEHTHKPGTFWIRLPLGILAFVTLAMYFYQEHIIEYFMDGKEAVEPHVAGLAAIILSGMLIMFLLVLVLYTRNLKLLEKISNHHFVKTIHGVLYNGYYVEKMITWFAQNIVLGSLAKSARWLDTNAIDNAVNSTIPVTQKVSSFFGKIQVGRIGSYMGQFIIGVAIMVIAALIMARSI